MYSGQAPLFNLGRGTVYVVHPMCIRLVTDVAAPHSLSAACIVRCCEPSQAAPAGRNQMVVSSSLFAAATLSSFLT